MRAKDRAYVFVAAWPAGMNADVTGEAIAEALGLDPFTAAEAARRGLPAFLARTDPATAAKGVKALLASRVAALMVTHAELASLLQPPLLRRLCPAVDAPQPMYLAHIDRGGTVGIRAADLRVLVRGRSRVMQGEVRNDSPSNLLNSRMDPIFGMPVPQSPAVRSRSATFTELLDLHLRDGSMFRLDASRFSFIDLLGKLGPSDIENTDRAAVILAEQAPIAQVDTSFGQPTGLTALVPNFMTVRAARGGTDRHGMLAFSLYSAILGVVSQYRRGKRPAVRG